MASEEPVLFDAGRGIYIAPIRHHSPACAWHLRALIAEIAPKAILIEGPADYDPLITLIGHAETKPPVAIVSIAESEQRGRAVSYFPFCNHSPEYVAIEAAQAGGIPVRFIDLPSGDKAMLRDAEADEFEPILPDERPFDSSAYVKALAERLGCRDGNEVWDHLFETRIARGDWRAFFADVGRYCVHMRAGTAAADMAADGTHQREAQMIAHLAAARLEIDGPILAVVGGFHAPVLASADLSAAKKPAKAAAGSAQPYLIRYGYRQLNALTGYGAGLPLPAYYDALWSTVEAGNAHPFDDLAHELMARYARHLRQALPGVRLAVPSLVTALENAHRLADLRGRPGPLRDDLFDACRSVFLKGEESGDATPIIAELAAFLTGSTIGDVPPSAGSPPLVEAVRARAKSLGFRVDDGERRNRDLDIYRNPRHRAASRFLHALAFLNSGFAIRTGGPDFRAGVVIDRLTEQWAVAWSPLVEATLIERAADGDSIEAVLTAELTRRIKALESDGQGGNAVAAIDLFATVCQAGGIEPASRVLPLIEAEVTRDPDLSNVAAALRDLVALWRAKPALGIDDGAPIERLIGAAWRRALFLLPDLVHAGEDRIAGTLDAMAILREIVGMEAGTLPTIDTVLFEEVIAALLEHRLDPALAGAVAALALLSGRIDEADFAGRLKGELGGAYPETAARVAWLRGVIIISRELLWRVPALIETADKALQGLDEDGFIELLPHIRLAFSRLDPREIDRLAQSVGEQYGVNPAGLVVSHEVSAGELDANMRADRAVAAMLAAEGLA